jgi:hypothetical protein
MEHISKFLTKYKMITSIENRKIIILEAVDRIQNFMDCDVVAEARDQIVAAENKDNLMEAIAYVLSAIDYRAPDRSGELDVLECYKVNRAIIKTIKDEIKAIESVSLYEAIKSGDNAKIADIESRVMAGEIVRLT